MPATTQPCATLRTEGALCGEGGGVRGRLPVFGFGQRIIYRSKSDIGIVIAANRYCRCSDTGP